MSSGYQRKEAYAHDHRWGFAEADTKTLVGYTSDRSAGVSTSAPRQRTNAPHSSGGGHRSRSNGESASHGQSQSGHRSPSRHHKSSSRDHDSSSRNHGSSSRPHGQSSTYRTQGHSSRTQRQESTQPIHLPFVSDHSENASRFSRFLRPDQFTSDPDVKPRKPTKRKKATKKKGWFSRLLSSFGFGGAKKRHRKRGEDRLSFACMGENGGDMLEPLNKQPEEEWVDEPQPSARAARHARGKRASEARRYYY